MAIESEGAHLRHRLELRLLQAHLPMQIPFLRFESFLPDLCSLGCSAGRLPVCNQLVTSIAE